MSKFTERSEILKQSGEGLLTRLLNVRSKFTSEKPPLLGDPVLSKVAGALVKRFPDIPGNDIDRVPGYDAFNAQAKSLYEVFQPFYDTFIDVVEWIQSALPTITECAAATASFSRLENPSLMNAFLDLVVMYAQVHVLYKNINDRRLVACTYGRLHYIVKCEKDPNWEKVAKGILATEDPWRKMQEDLHPAAKKIASSVYSLMQSYMKVGNLQLLRKDGAINITVFDEKMGLPANDSLQLDFFDKERMTNYILYGFLLSPSELGTPGVLPLLKMALAQGWIAYVYGNVGFNVHDEYDDLFKNYKSKTLKLDKDRKMIAEAQHLALTSGVDSHFTMRVFLRQELRNLYNLFKDFPGLIGPKIVPVWAGLNAAREEILWYFRHLTYAPPKTKTKFNLDRFRDKKIPELIYYVQQLTRLIRSHYNIIQTYYLEYLRTADLSKLNELSGSVRAAGGNVITLIESLSNDLSSLSVDAAANGTEYDLQPIRLNWLRIEEALSSSSATVTAGTVKELVHRGRLICLHSKNADSIEEMISEYASLKHLYQYRRVVTGMFEKTIAEGRNARYAIAFVRLFQEFGENGGKWTPLEREPLGKYCVATVEKMLSSIGDRISKALLEIVRFYLRFDSQLQHVHAAYPLLQKQENYKFDKNFVHPVDPAIESQYRTRPQLKPLRVLERTVQLLCAACNESDTIDIHDTQFVPREFIAEGITAAIKEFISKAVVVDPTGKVQRPSVFEKKIQLFITVIKQVSNGIDFDVDFVVRKTMLGEIHHSQTSAINKLEWSVDAPLKWEAPSAAKYIAQWYGDFVTRTLNQPGVMYSPLRRQFLRHGKEVSSKEAPVNVEEYADMTEMMSLNRLLGPYGIKILDRELLKFVAGQVGVLKQMLNASKEGLKPVVANFNREEVLGAGRGLRDLDGFYHRSVLIGNVLMFRTLLHEATRLVSQVTVPHIYEVVSSGFLAYPRNRFLQPEYLESDALASAVGLEVSSFGIDQSLVAVVSKIITEADRDLWALLPYMYAACFLSKSWLETGYRPAVEGHDNNAHVLTATMHLLFAATKGVSAGTGGDVKVIVEAEKTFLEVSSFILLRLAQGQGDKLKIRSFPAILIFLEQFLETSSVLNRTHLDDVVPYALLRSSFSSLYHVTSQKVKGKKRPGDRGEMG